MDIAITDDGGHLTMFHRMDAARITSIEIAINKAFTAASARRPTRDYASSGRPGGAATRHPRQPPGPLHDFPRRLADRGRRPRRGRGRLSSGHSDQDEAVAQAGVDAFLKAVGHERRAPAGARGHADRLFDREALLETRQHAHAGCRPCSSAAAARGEWKPNLITIAWTGTVCTDPPMLSISVPPDRHSHGIIRSTGEFVVNVPSVEPRPRPSTGAAWFRAATRTSSQLTGLTPGTGPEDPLPDRRKSAR